MTDTNQVGDAAAAAAAAASAAAAAAKPWYEGKADAETIGHWDNKAWDKSDPIKIAIEATKSAREAQKFVGAPPERLLRLPEKPDAPEWKDVYSRLGVPDDVKGYDLSGVKNADGSDLAPAFADTMRAAMLTARVPKDNAAEIVKAVVKQRSDTEAAASAENAVRIAAEKVELAKNWGDNAALNRLHAMEGAKRLGLDAATVDNLEVKVGLGYSKVMEALRKIGKGTSEDTFIESNQGGAPVTANGAAARLAELQADQGWTDRFLKGGSAERREFDALTTLVAGLAA